MKSWFFICALIPLTVNASDVHIVLDPANGGPNDAGASTASFQEKTATLDLAKRIQTQIDQEDKFDVVLTRIGDYPVTLNDRRKIINQYREGVYISLHVTTYDEQPSVVTYVLKQAVAKPDPVLSPIETVHSKEYVHSMKLAEFVEDEFPEHVDHEIVIPKYSLSSLVGIRNPAILIECKCIGPDASSDSTIDTVARAISAGVQTFARKVY